MSTTWTQAQEAAMNTHDKTLLVSAAAGSGKTATLTERIIRSLMKEDGGDISRMLIVTYTRAAAAELKLKISKALSLALAENPQNHRLAEQMMKLENAKICTIDSFYFDIVKSNFSRLGLSGKLRIVDNAEMTLLYRNEMDRLIDELYDTRQGFSDFMDHFVAVRGRDNSVNIFLSIYQSLLSQKNGVNALLIYSDTLRDGAHKDFLSTVYGESATKPFSKTMLTYAMQALQTACSFFDICEDTRPKTNYGPAFENDMKTVKDALDAIMENNYQRAKSVLDGYEKLSLKTIRGDKDEYVTYLQNVRTDICKKLLKLREDYFSLTQKEISKLMLATADVTDGLYALLSEFDKRLNVEKEERGICDFSDIRRYVLRILLDENGIPTDVAKDYRSRFDEIYIDEYQDVDETQDSIFCAISTPTNRFMVGDIKQSIYAFRGADSRVFAKYKSLLPLLGSEASESAEGCSIFMSHNFRCDKSIIDFSNLISSYLFSICAESIGYQREDDLIYGKAPPCEDYVAPKVTIALTGVVDDSEEKEETEEDNEKETCQYEAEYIVSEITRLLSCERKANKEPIQPKDIAILVRQNTDIELLSETLTRAGIPSQSVDRKDFFENPDVLLVISLLSAIDNPRRDIPLAGTLRSPFYGFSMDELILIRRSAESELSLYDALEQYALNGDSALCRKCGDFVESLTYWREKAMALPADKLIQKLYREFSILSLAKDNRENLLRLYEYARSFEANAFHGLYGFIAYINEIIENGAKLDKDSAGAESNAVHLITIHHSKGLEFPVCFLYGMGKPFNERFKKETIQFDPVLGIGVQLHDNTGFAYTDTPVRRAIIDQKVLSGRQEEMRVLYVAMTRARERLYLTAKVSSPSRLEKKVRAFVEFGKEYGVYHASSYLEWIFSAIKSSPNSDSYRIEYVYADDNTVTAVRQDTSKNEAPMAENEELTELFRKRFSFVYPYAHVSSLPAKLSVSSLYPAILDEGEEEEIEPISLEKAFVYPESLLPQKGGSGAERGTATHTFLQFCDFDRVLSHGVTEEISRLLSEKFIDERTARLCQVYQLERFFLSNLFAEIKAADKVWREQRFHIFLPASEFTEQEERAELLKDETIAVQGVIDLFFRDANGEIVLVDYKTDYLTEEELTQPELAEEKLRARHRTQLSYYQKAIEQILGKAPKKTLIYSLPLAKSIPV